MAVEILASSDETRRNLRESVSMGVYSPEQLAELVTKSVLLAGEAFASGDLKESHAEISFAADLLVYMIGKERDAAH